MTTIKIILMSTAIALFISVPLVVEAEEAKDCSQFKKLHKKLICKTGGYDDNGESFNEKYKTLADFAKKKEDSSKDKKSKDKKKGESFNEKYKTLADLAKKKENSSKDKKSKDKKEGESFNEKYNSLADIIEKFK